LSKTRVPGRHTRWWSVAVAAIGLSAALSTPFAVAGSEAPAAEGIWKAVVPAPGTMHGEFDNHDPFGLSAGAAIKADCSINWTDPDAGQLYCFSSATSLELFLEAPQRYLERARAQWRRLEARSR
jgi:hypothetical protein